MRCFGEHPLQELVRQEGQRPWPADRAGSGCALRADVSGGFYDDEVHRLAPLPSAPPRVRGGSPLRRDRRPGDPMKACRCVTWIPGMVTIVSRAGNAVAIRDFSLPAGVRANG